MARRFAEGTKVSASKSRQDIEKLLINHGATEYVSGWNGTKHVIQCSIGGRRLRFEVKAPDNTVYESVRAWQAEERRLWRVLVLAVKLKLEMVESGDSDLDTEFLPNLVLPSGEPLAFKLMPMLDKVLAGKPLPPLLGE